MKENTPYDEFVERIITATSREGRSLDDWSKEVIALQEGYATPRTDLEVYAKRRTLDAYWQRKEAIGVKGAMQVAHAFLGLRLECAQCHRHPHDTWQQDDLLSFANYFTHVRRIGFVPASTLDDALEIASDTVGRSPTITHLHTPPIMMADVRA